MIKTRAFCISFVLYTSLWLCTSSVYQSRLTSKLTIPEKPHQIDTLKELAKSNYNIITLVRYKVMLNRSLHKKIRKRLVSRIEVISEEEQLARLTQPLEQALICKRHLAEYAIIHRNNTVNGVPFYRMIKENPMPSLVCFVVKYGSPFLRRIDEIFHHLVESGIFRQWRKDALFNISIGGKLDKRRPSENVNKLNVTNLRLCFLILAYGFVLSIITFLLEYYVFPNVRRLSS